MELGIFAYQSHLNLVQGMLPGIDHGAPVVQIRFRTVKL